MDLLVGFFSHWYSILAVILVFGGLIFFHELGHFLAARAMGVGVVTFSLGMGPKLITIRRGKTDYCLSAIPFGGYVSSVGEYGPEVEELGFTQEEAIGNRPPWQRLVLAFAGPFANILLAWLIYWGVALGAGMGIPLPEIGAVLDPSPAMSAGIQKGDMVVAINGIKVDEWSQVPQLIGASGGQEVSVLIDRQGQEVTVALSPELKQITNIFGEEEKAFIIGIQSAGTARHVPLNFTEAAVEGWNQTWFMMEMTLKGLWKLITGSVSADAVGGPILIAQMVGEQAAVGLLPLLMLTALISVNLGLLNLLPVPILDGGLILFCLVEMVIRRPINAKFQERAMTVGAFLLIGLMVFATFNDVMRIFE